jgi:small subunit ribosomal protein S20
MPILKNAVKKMRQDAKTTLVNQSERTRLKTTLAATRKSATASKISEAFSLLDRASKKGLIHPNKAARQKSQLSKLIIKEVTASTKVRPKTKRVVKKTS